MQSVRQKAQTVQVTSEKMEGAINAPTVFEPNFDGDNGQLSRLIVVLEGAFLESVKVKDKYQLLNVDDHVSVLHKHKRKADEARPDITHQTVLALMDSPLNKAGLLEVWIHTHSNVCIKIDPTVRVPRTFKRFCGLIVQLLHKMTIRAEGSNKKLLSVVKGPIDRHLPKNIRVVAFSRVAPRAVSLDAFVEEVCDHKTPPSAAPVCFIIGAIAHGHIDTSYATDKVSISQYPLSAAAVASRVCASFERYWAVH